MSAEIYALCDPGSGEVRYIGKAVDAQKRLASHLRDANRRDTPVYRWIRKLQERGCAPVVKVLEVVDDTEWKARERSHIQAGRESGLRLLNVADGGDEPFCPPEVRAENGRRAARARIVTPQKRRLWKLKRNLAMALRDGVVSDATKDKMRKRMDVFGSFARFL